MYKLIIFDLDGTMFNTAPGITKAMSQLLERHNRPKLSDETIISYIGHGLEGLAKNVWPELLNDPEKTQQLIHEFKELYDDCYLEGSHMYDGLLDFLNQWDGRIAVVSNKTLKYVQGLVQSTPLKDHKWEYLIGGDVPEQRKPQPDGIESVLIATGIAANECVMIGDHAVDIQAAKSAQVSSVAVTFGFSDHEELKSHSPTGVLHHYNDLMSLLTHMHQQ